VLIIGLLGVRQPLMQQVRWGSRGIKQFVRGRAIAKAMAPSKRISDGSGPAPANAQDGGSLLMAAKRSIMRIQLDTSAKERLDQICKRRGMTQISVMSRLVNWFNQQDDIIQTDILQQLSEGSLAGVAKQLLKKLATGEKTSG
jgi:hypothetical protein